MPVGIEVFDGQNRKVFDTGNRLYRILTTLPAGPGGSFTHAEIGGATIVGAVVLPSDPNMKPPVVSVSGNTASWGFTGNANQANDTAAHIQILVF